MHILIPGTCEYVTFHGKRNFADVTWVRILKWEGNPGLSGWPKLITTWVFKNEKTCPYCDPRNMWLEKNGQRCNVSDFEDGEGSLKSRNAHRLYKLEMQRSISSPKAPWKEYDLADTMIFTQWHHVGLLTYKNCKIINLCVLSH